MPDVCHPGVCGDPVLSCHSPADTDIARAWFVHPDSKLSGGLLGHIHMSDKLSLGVYARYPHFRFQTPFCWVSWVGRVYQP